MSIARRAGSLQDYISSIRGGSQKIPSYDKTARGSVLDQRLAQSQAQAEPETRVATEAGPAKAASGISKQAALDYTKGGVAVVQGIADAMQRQKDLQAEMMSQSAAGAAGASVKRSKMQAEGQQTPLRQIMAAYRPR